MNYYLKSFKYLIFLIFSFIIILTFRKEINICIDFDYCYSKEITHHLQLDSLIKGNLKLNNTPVSFLHDWNWGINGFYQTWGIGIPLLRAPFEILSRLFFSYKYFPDQLILFFYSFIIILFTSIVNYKFFKEYLKLDNFFSILLSFILSSNIILNKAIISMLSHRLMVYAESIYFAYLFGILLCYTTIIFFFEKKNKHLYIFCLLAGFSSFFRATFFLYAIVIYVSLIFFGIKLKNYLTILRSFCVFSVGIICQLLFNLYRFGNILEFGYSLNLSSLSFNDYSLRFSYPFLKASFREAFLELFSFIFLVDKTYNGISYNKKVLLYQADYSRFREITFDTFNIFDLFLFLGSLLIIVFGLYKFREAKFRDLLYGLSFAGILSFFCIFIFYLYSPSIISRYTIDFLLAFKIINFSAILIIVLIFKDIIHKNKLP